MIQSRQNIFIMKVVLMYVMFMIMYLKYLVPPIIIGKNKGYLRGCELYLGYTT